MTDRLSRDQPPSICILCGNGNDLPEGETCSCGRWGIVFHAQRNEEFCRDGQKHDWQGWREIDGGLGGERVCSKCGMGAMEHSLRYSE